MRREERERDSVDRGRGGGRKTDGQISINYCCQMCRRDVLVRNTNRPTCRSLTLIIAC